MKAIFVLIVVTSIEQALAAPSFNCNNTATQCLPSESVVTCTCTVEDALGTQSTQWEGTAVSECPITPNEIVFIHPSFTARPPVQCGDRLVAAPVSQDFRNYTSDVSITVDTTNNGSNISCSLAGTSPPVGVTTLRVGEIPPAPSTLNLESLTRGRFSLTWMQPMKVFGGVGSYEVTVRSDQSGNISRLCGHMSAPNGEGAPLREFTDWITEGQVCNFSVTTVTGDNCNFRSDPSQDVAITLQGPNQTTVENIILGNPIYIDNYLRRINISFMYTQESPVMIIDGHDSSTTNFRITYAYSASGSCTTIVPSSCDEQLWCNYTLSLNNCSTQTVGNGIFNVVPLNAIGSGNISNSSVIANVNPLFTVMNRTDTNSPGNISLQLSFSNSFLGDCYLEYGLGADCRNRNVTKRVPVNSDPVLVNFTLTISGMYCYRINCSSTIAEGTINYQSRGNGGRGDGDGDGGSLWWIVFVVIGVLLIIIGIVIIVCVCIRRPWEDKDSQDDTDTTKKKKKEETRVDIESSNGPGQQLLQDDKFYADPSSIEHEPAPTGDEYAMVDMSNKRKAKPRDATVNQAYQDPSSIEHEQGPTGDEYAMPQQKGRKKGKHQGSSVDPEGKSADVGAMYSTVDTSKKKNQLTYAQIDVGSGSGGKPVPQSTPYATVVRSNEQV